MHEHQVLVVGAGFAGIKTAIELADNVRLKVTLLSDREDFRYYPSLYHTATGGVRSQSSIPITEIIPDNIDVAIGSAKTLDRQKRTIITEEGDKLKYDTLILALGVVTNYFGIKGLEEYSYGIKSIDQVEELKAHLHKQLADDHKPDLNYVIVGAGPTGIELAGALPHYLREIMRNHGVKHRAVHIDLIEAAPRLLPRLPSSTSRSVRKQLRKLKIKLYLGQAVQGETADQLTVNGKPIMSHTVIWTAGVTNHSFFKVNNFSLSDRGKVNVDEYLQAEEHIYVLGDNANTKFSGLAQTAVRDGKFAADNIKRELAGKKPRAYRPKQPITVIPAGPHWAAVNWGKLHFQGRLGSWLREAADFIAFHDLEPWWKASEQWMTEFQEEEDCPVCTKQS